MLGPKGMAFDNDEILDSNDDEDLKSDPVSQMDMQVRIVARLFWIPVDSLEDTLVVFHP